MAGDAGRRDEGAKRRQAQRRGHWSEIKAALFLLVTGHRILALRYKTAGGEADIIAKRGELILIVEVKARANVRDCVEAVTSASQRRIHSAADHWLSRQKNGQLYSVRFDIIAVTPWRLPKHFKNMF